MDKQTHSRSLPKQIKTNLGLLVKLIIRNYKTIYVVQFIISCLFIVAFYLFNRMAKETRADAENDPTQTIESKLIFNNYYFPLYFAWLFNHQLDDQIYSKISPESDPKKNSKLLQINQKDTQTLDSNKITTQDISESIPNYKSLIKETATDSTQSEIFVTHLHSENKDTLNLQYYNSIDWNLGAIPNNWIKGNPSFIKTWQIHFYGRQISFYSAKYASDASRSLLELHKTDFLTKNTDQQTVDAIKNRNLVFINVDSDTHEIPALKSGSMILFTLIVFCISITLSINFYPEIVKQKMVQFIDMLGISKPVQYFSILTIHLILTTYYIVFASLMYAIMTEPNNKVFKGDIIVYFFLLGLISLNCFFVDIIGISLSKGKSKIIRNAFFCAIILVPVFIDFDFINNSKVLSLILNSNPLRAFDYFSEFKKSENKTALEALKACRSTFNNTTLLGVLLGFLTHTIIFGIFSVLIFSLKTNLFLVSKNFLFMIIRTILSPFRGKSSINFIKKDSSLCERSKGSLIIHNLTKIYQSITKSFTAVNNVSLEIRKGEKVALLGHNGAGKSTLMNILTGINQPTMGQVFLDGKEITSVRDIAGDIGFCPQYTSNIPSFTTLQNLEIVQNWFDIPSSTTNYLLEKLSLSSKKNTLASKLSGGQLRKLSFALAIISRRKLIVLDEPSTGVDVLSRRTMLELLEEFSKDSIVIYSTHLIEEAETVSDRIAILSGGKLVANDNALNIKTQFNLNRLRLKVTYNDSSKKVNETIQVLNGIEGLDVKPTKSRFFYTFFDMNKTSNLNISLIHKILLENKQALNISSYALSRPTLEDVLSLEEFREETNLLQQNKQTKKAKEHNATIKPVKIDNASKGVTTFNLFRALIYNTFANFIKNFNHLIFSLAIIFLSTNLYLDYHFKINREVVETPFSLSHFNFHSGKKFRIQFINNGEISDDFSKTFNNSNSVNKNSFEIINTDLGDENLEEYLKGSVFQAKMMKSESEVYFINFDWKTDPNLKHYGHHSIIKDRLTSLVIPTYKHENYGLIFASLYTEYLSLKLFGNEANKSFSLKQKSLIPTTPITSNVDIDWIKDYLVNFFKIIAIIIILQYLVMQQIKNEYCNGLSKMWTVYGIPPFGLTCFNILTSTIYWFFMLGTPLAILKFTKKLELMEYFINELFILLIASLFNLLLFIYVVHRMLPAFAAASVVLASFLLMIAVKLFLFVGSLTKFEKMPYINYIMPAFPLFNYFLFFLNPGVEGFAPKVTEYVFSDNYGLTLFSNKLNFDKFYSGNIFICLIQTISLLVLLTILELNFLEFFGRLFIKIRFRNTIHTLKTNKIVGASTLQMSKISGSDVKPLKEGNDPLKVPVKFDNTSKIYCGLFERKPNLALSKFKLAIKQGDTIALVGSNGSGKTTSFKMLIREIKPTSGSIMLQGRDISKSANNFLSYVPQYEPNPENLTPFKILWFYTQLRGFSWGNSNKAVVDALTKTKLIKNAHKKVAQLSGGNKRKVALAISLLMDRDMMLLDEPTTGVDIANCKEIWDAIKEIDETKSVLLSSHSMQESEYLAEKLAILIRGKLIAFNTTEAIKEQFGEVYDVEINFKEKNENGTVLEVEEVENIKESMMRKLMGRFKDVEIKKKSTFRFNVFISKKETNIVNLIKYFDENMKQFEIEEFFVAEMSIEEILSRLIDANDEK